METKYVWSDFFIKYHIIGKGCMYKNDKKISKTISVYY